MNNFPTCSLKVFPTVHLLSLVLAVLLFSAQAIAQEDPVIVTGNELFGRVENGYSVREVVGNVVLHQGNVVITCDRAIQFLAANNARLIGRVVVTQDTLTIRTDEGFYYGNERRAFSDKGVILDDKKVILTAITGEYFFKQAKADFRQNVNLTDSAAVLTADRLIYFRKENKAIAYGNVRITDPENTIFADSLIHMRSEKTTFGYGSVKVQNLKDHTEIYGHRLSDYRAKLYTLVEDNPILVQVDTTFNETKDTVISVDTMVIKSNKMEAYRDSSDQFIATDSVSILRGQFASKSDFSIFRNSAGQIQTYKMGDSLMQPILWYDRSQLTGDTVLINMKDKEIESADIRKQAMIISGNEFYPARFDQVTGEQVKMYFRANKLIRTEIFANVLSLYFLYEEDEASGLIKASAKDAKIEFLNSKVDEVHLYGEPKSEFYPEVLVAGKEKQFTLPQFRIYDNRPDKKGLFSSIKNNRFKF